MKFNINDYVKVKLTDKGRHLLRGRYEKLNIMAYGSLGEYKEKETDENGYTKFQMHELMNTFGNYIRPGEMELPFETNIIIYHRESTTENIMNKELCIQQLEKTINKIHVMHRCTSSNQHIMFLSALIFAKNSLEQEEPQTYKLVKLLAWMYYAYLNNDKELSYRLEEDILIHVESIIQGFGGMEKLLKDDNNES